jgi:hypothetical protein
MTECRLSVDVERKVYGVGCGSATAVGPLDFDCTGRGSYGFEEKRLSQLPDPSKRDGPGMTVGEQQKLKNELTNTRDRQNSQVKARGGAAQPKSKKP